MMKKFLKLLRLFSSLFDIDDDGYSEIFSSLLNIDDDGYSEIFSFLLNIDDEYETCCCW